MHGECLHFAIMILDIYVKYKIEAYDAEGKCEFTVGGFCKLYLEKVDGEWELTDVYERP